MNEKNHKNSPQAQSETLSLIKKQFFKTKMCPFQKNKNYCLNESNCHYAHSVDELKPMPDLRNTKLCDYIKKKVPCRDINCKFAHDIDTLKPSVHLATYKSTICSFWGKGKCFNGNKCRFAHGNDDIKTNEGIDALAIAKYNRKHAIKNKNKNSISDLKQGTASTYSFNTCDYSANDSLETTNVSSSFDKSGEALVLNKSNTSNGNIKTKNNLDMFNLNNEIAEERNENTDTEIMGNEFSFCDKNDSTNSIKDVIHKIENMALSTFIENNDKYTKVIKYLMNENTILKESIRKEQMQTMIEQDQKEQMKKRMQRSNFESTLTTATVNNGKDNGDDLVKYLYAEETNNGNKEKSENIENNENNHINGNCDINVNSYTNGSSNIIGNNYSNGSIYINENSYTNENGDLNGNRWNSENSENIIFLSNEQRNANIGMPTYEDTIKVDENFNSIIKTIDDILISQNVCSFPNIKDTNSSYEGKDMYPMRNNNDMTNREYENLLCNMKSFETVRSIYPGFNSFNAVDNSRQPIIRAEAEMLDRALEESMVNSNLQAEKKKKSYYDENFSCAKYRSFPHNSSTMGVIGNNYSNGDGNGNGNSNGNNYSNNNSNSNHYSNQRANDAEELSFPPNFKPAIFSHKELPSQEVRNVQQTRMQAQRMNKEQFSQIVDVDPWKGSMVTLRNENSTDAMGSNNMNCNLGGNIHSDSFHGGNIPRGNFHGNFSNDGKANNYSDGTNISLFNNFTFKQNNTLNVMREKNAKLNLRENMELNDGSMNLDKLLEFSSDKSDILKKIKKLISNELQNNENYNYSNKTKNNYTSIFNGNNSMFKKNTLLNDNVQLTSFNTPDVTNNTLVNNANVNTNQNNSFYDHENNSNNSNNKIYDTNGNNCHHLNYNFPQYKKENINEQNIWNDNSNFNDFAFPVMSPHDWINNQKGGDFFNMSKSVNLSSLN
ncbi:zinc finger protein, putative [Plasmodium ovale wallikeri]|uniref:Zinc finger protein, putative n=1 Tax=Plasmodium ovale wallikeri TaxID=864142 RepID=A0A1A8ZMC0_PLAOA|nr:zinc finger protein, putative [Plasmodium ovale wallikeri]